MAAVQPELILHRQVYGGLETCSEVCVVNAAGCHHTLHSEYYASGELCMQSKNKYINKVKYISLLPFPEGRIQFAAH